MERSDIRELLPDFAIRLRLCRVPLRFKSIMLELFFRWPCQLDQPRLAPKARGTYGPHMILSASRAMHAGGDLLQLPEHARFGLDRG